MRIQKGRIITTPLRIISQKSADLKNIADEAWNQGRRSATYILRKHIIHSE
jgi:hypothetical protein